MSMTPRSISTPGTPRSRGGGRIDGGNGNGDEEGEGDGRFDNGTGTGDGEIGIARSPSEPGHRRRANGGNGVPSMIYSLHGRRPGQAERSSGDEFDSEDEIMVAVGKGTRPGTPVPGRGMVLGQRVKREDKGRDPVS